MTHAYTYLHISNFKASGSIFLIRKVYKKDCCCDDHDNNSGVCMRERDDMNERISEKKQEKKGKWLLVRMKGIKP